MTLDDSYREMCLEVESLRASLARKVRHCDEITEERDQMQRERDEARAKIAGLPAWQKGCEQALADLADAEEAIVRLYTERDEARAEVQDYREQLRKLPDANRVASQDAYRRGAEAMREACAREASVCANHRGEELDAILSALPIPEEP